MLSISQGQALLGKLSWMAKPAATVLGNVPFFIISLPKAVNRREQLCKSLFSFGIKALIVDGVDPRPNNKKATDYVPTDKAIAVQATTRDGWTCTFHLPPKDHKNLTYGELGCTLAHLMAMRHVLDSGYDYGLVGEDDIVMDAVPFWDCSLDTLVKQAPKDWDILHLQPTKYAHTHDRQRYSRRTSFGTIFYCIRAEAVARLWEHCGFNEGTHFDLGKMVSRRMAADVILYHQFKTYVNYAFCSMLWKNTNSTGSQIHSQDDRIHTDRCALLIRSCIHHVLHRYLTTLPSMDTTPVLRITLIHDLGTIHAKCSRQGMLEVKRRLSPFITAMDYTTYLPVYTFHTRTDPRWWIDRHKPSLKAVARLRRVRHIKKM